MTIRVLLVEANDDSTVGGSHHSMFDFVRLLDRSRYEPIVCFYRDNPFVARLRALGVAVEVVEDKRAVELRVRKRGRFLPKVADALRGIGWRHRLINKLGISLLHINNSPLQGADDWLPAARLSGIPIVSMLRTDSGLEHRRIRFLAKRFDRLVAVSHHMAADFSRIGMNPTRIDVVYNGIDFEALRAQLSEPRAAIRMSLGVQDDQILVLMVANIRGWKGQHVVLDALALMAPLQLSKLRLAFMGDAGEADQEYLESLQSKIANAGLGAVVQFLGFRKDVANYLAAADIAVHASISPEPFGRVIVEAMGLGVPIVASRLGGPTEIVTDETGCLFNPSKPAELADILSCLMTDEARRAELSAAGLVRAETFDVARMVAGLTGAYDSALRRRKE